MSSMLLDFKTGGLLSDKSDKRTNINIHNASKPSELGSSCLQQHRFPSLEKSGCSQANKAPVLVSLRLQGHDRSNRFVPSEKESGGNASLERSSSDTYKRERVPKKLQINV